MLRRAGVLCSMALLFAGGAIAQTGSSGTSTEQNPGTQPSSSAVAPAEALRPATTTFFGDTGLWFVPSAEVLPRGRVSATGYRRGTNYRQGFSNVADFAGTIGVGISDRVELFGSFLFDTRYDRDLRPIFVNDAEVGGIIDRYPRRNSGWSGDNVGDLFAGAKVNLRPQARADGVAFALRGIAKVPTGDEDAGVSNGQPALGVDFVVSKEAARAVELAGFAGYEWRGMPDYLDGPNGAFRWGVGAGFPSRSPLRATIELFGFIPSQDQVTLTGGRIVATDGSLAPLVSDTENLTYLTPTLTWQSRNGFFIGGGVSLNVPWKGREGFNADSDPAKLADYVDWQVRIGYHPGARTYVPPPPPPPPPPPEHTLAVQAACNPCTVEAGKTSTVTATVDDSISCAVTYRWSAPSGTFANATERQTIWTAPAQAGTVPVTVTVTCPSDGKTASDAVNLQVPPPPARTYAFEDVHFDFDRYSLRPEAARILDDAVAAMREDRALRLTIEGHTCNIGTAEYNLALGDRRAISVRDYLVSQGVAADRLNTISYGEERPKYDNSREETRRLNRRAALVVRLQ
ncbi:MAG: OmpA family protein [Acidobacteria bacterium]|nr:OmpA family protein [Acidobacteriota bacterium]